MLPVSIREKRPRQATVELISDEDQDSRLDTLIPPWRMTCNLKSFGASEEEVQDFGPKELSLWHFLLGQWC